MIPQGQVPILVTVLLKKIKNNAYSKEMEIIFVEENGNLIPKISKELTGFLSSEKRFSDSNLNYNEKMVINAKNSKDQ